MDLLLDVNIVIDLCAPRLQWHVEARSLRDNYLFSDDSNQEDVHDH